MPIAATTDVFKSSESHPAAEPRSFDPLRALCDPRVKTPTHALPTTYNPATRNPPRSKPQLPPCRTSKSEYQPRITRSSRINHRMSFPSVLSVPSVVHAFLPSVFPWRPWRFSPPLPPFTPVPKLLNRRKQRKPRKPVATVKELVTFDRTCHLRASPLLLLQFKSSPLATLVNLAV
jgi:hypothetical protein